GARIGDRRDQVHAQVTVGHFYRGRLPCAGVTVAGVLVRGHPGLIAPVNLRSFPKSPSLDGGVSLPQPGADFGRVLIPPMAARPLERVPPALEVLSHRAHRQGPAALLADQVAHGTAI